MGLGLTKLGEVFITTLEGHILAAYSNKNKRVFTSLPKGDLQGICCNSRGEILTVDRASNQVLIFSQDGTLVRQFGRKGDGPNELNAPRGICVDDSDNILVADTGNKRISIFTAEGIPIRQVDGETTHICIHKGRILSLSNNHIDILSN